MPKFLTAILISALIVPPLAVNQINTRRSYYPKPLGEVFENKIWYHLSKLEDLGFKLLDPNFYLFASHPRENG